MAAILFADVLKRASRGNLRYGAVSTRDWFRETAMETKKADPNKIINSREGMLNGVGSPLIGNMFLFNYDPKHKATLPYYDSFPLIFPIELYSDGFLGINMHYLPPLMRARLMDVLYSTLSDKRYDERTHLQVSYKLLVAASRFSYFKPALKRYLYSHVRSKLVKIDAKEWDYTLFLPLARFQKASQSQVWRDSKNFIGGN